MFIESAPCSREPVLEFNFCLIVKRTHRAQHLEAFGSRSALHYVGTVLHLPVLVLKLGKEIMLQYFMHVKQLIIYLLLINNLENLSKIWGKNSQYNSL